VAAGNERDVGEGPLFLFEANAMDLGFITAWAALAGAALGGMTCFAASCCMLFAKYAAKNSERMPRFKQKSLLSSEEMRSGTARR
jgi:hypothetical protein